MAFIQIQKKRKPLWPWLVGLVAALLLGWLTLRALSQKDPGEFEPLPGTNTTEVNEPGQAGLH